MVIVNEQRHVWVGNSPRARQVWKQVEKLGKGRWPALLLGETGSGKEVVAREIYNRNPQGPFVTVDCSSLVGPLMESELFGHVKGAFTGAANAKTGLIELANNGTAFFDEIGELPIELQSKLLRVLQEKEFRPIGSTITRKSDFRIIAATNRDLAKEVEKGTFRRDLYFRLNVVTVRLAALRERKEDIPALVNHFLTRANFQMGSTFTLTAEAMEVLLSYEWPGNIRELENCIQHMVAMNTGTLLHQGALPSALQSHITAKKAQYLMATAGAGFGGASYNGAAHSAASSNGASHSNGSHAAMSSSPAMAHNGGENLPGIVPLAELERRAILNAIEYTKGDRAVAAHLLGIGRTTLYRKLKEYNLEP